MLYATLRDEGRISPEVAKIVGIEAREGKQETRKQEASLNAQKSLDNLDGYNSSGDENPTIKSELSPRQALVLEDRSITKRATESKEMGRISRPT
ncbi:hypothetical protein AJ87_06915 [Rhizobium yanglingense]|nr:hypothetical protein AJ87_06915 [Rhizobium yanglingense]